ncbi:MAG: hypothetical protein V4598_16180 [Bdellovibrionota bacterium]
MRPFLTSKRKLIDLIVVITVSAVIWPLLGMEAAFLFCFGFIWNWAASQDLTQYMSGKSYRFTMLKLVTSSQTLILSPAPIQRLPEFAKAIVRSLPAGIFWWAVIWTNDSDLPVWATFAGSLVFELSQWDVLFSKKVESV